MDAIDLNCDLGERVERGAEDAALLEVVSSANIACGGHAGDEHTMMRTVRTAVARGVAVGAHPGYPDRAHFGRVAVRMSVEAVEESVAEQIGALQRIAGMLGARIAHVKPHGALYHAAMSDPEIARAIGRAAMRAGGAGPERAPVLVGLAGASALAVWRGLGLSVAPEAFADRRYEPDGSLRERTRPGSLIADPAQAAAQAVRIAQERAVIASDGTTVPVTARTICIHSDTPDAVAIARSVRAALEAASIRVAPIRV